MPAGSLTIRCSSPPSSLLRVTEPIRIVLVEDNQVFREALELLLQLRSDVQVVASVADGAQAVEAAERRVEELTAALREARQTAAEPFSTAVAAELEGIGLGAGEFRVDLAERELSAAGADTVAFLIRPNAGMPFAPVAETASGGELSRIALAIAAVGGGETIVFDEIDAGIGGQTAHAVGETLERLATRAQVLTITHLPQIASRADRHFRVEKLPGDPTHTRIEPLVEAERREEIQRMLGGREFLTAVQRD